MFVYWRTNGRITEKKNCLTTRFVWGKNNTFEPFAHSGLRGFREKPLTSINYLELQASLRIFATEAHGKLHQTIEILHSTINSY